MAWYRRWLRWPSRSTLLVLGIAQGWGQVKLWLTLVVAWTVWPAWTQWGVGTVLAVVITLACFRSTEWAVRKWGPDAVWYEHQTPPGTAPRSRASWLASPVDTVFHSGRHGRIWQWVFRPGPFC